MLYLYCCRSDRIECGQGTFTLRQLAHSYTGVLIFGFDFLQLSRGNGLFQKVVAHSKLCILMCDVWVGRCNCLPSVVFLFVFLLTATFKCMP